MHDHTGYLAEMNIPPRKKSPKSPMLLQRDIPNLGVAILSHRYEGCVVDPCQLGDLAHWMCICEIRKEGLD